MSNKVFLEADVTNWDKQTKSQVPQTLVYNSSFSQFEFVSGDNIF